jgi:hypothetical protein
MPVERPLTRTAVRIGIGLELAVLVLACAILIIHVLLARPYVVDDAYISFRVLREFLAGNGLVYNVGEHVEAYSNFLWLLLLSPGAALGLDPVSLSRALGLICTLICMVCTWGLARQLAPRGPAAIIAVLLMASLTPFAFWSMAGLETPLVAALIAAMAWSLFREAAGAPAWPTGLLMALLALARPEMILLVVATWIWEIAGRWSEGKRGPALLTRNVWLHIGITALAYVPYTAWRRAYYGNLLPATVRAKSTGLHTHTVVRGGYYLAQFVAAPGVLPTMALAVIGVALLWRGVQRNRMYYLAGIVLGYAALMFLGGGDWMPQSRLFVHILPFLLVLAGYGAGSLILWLRDALGDRWVWQGALAGLLALQIGVGLFDSVDPNGSLAGGIGTPPANVAWLKEVRPGETIEVVEAGILAYKSPLRTRVVDMVGLANDTIANLPSRFPGGAFAHYNVFGKWDVNYYLAQNPRFLELMYIGTGATGYVQTAFIGATELANDPRFKARYFLRPDDIYERRASAP